MGRNRNNANRLAGCALAACALLASAALLLGGCAESDKESGGWDGKGGGYITDVDELHGKPIAVLTGTLQEQIAHDQFPDSKVLCFDAQPDAIAALLAGKAATFLADEIDALNLMGEFDNVKILDESLYNQEFAFVFQKNSERADAIRTQFDQWIAENTENGKLQEISDKWLSEMSAAPSEEVTFSGENGTLAVCLDATLPPYEFVREGKMAGLDVDVVNLFCQAYGYVPEYTNMKFGALLASVASGKHDMATGAICITEERKQEVDFTLSYAKSPVVAVALCESEDAGIFGGLAESFTKTFITENRWQLIAGGIGTTLLISVLAAIFGTVLGFAIYLICRRGNKVLNAVFDAFAYVFGGLPIVVLLMVFYYLVLANAPLSGTGVSIVAFTLSLGFTVYAQLKTAVKSIDRGQTEGAQSLGFTDWQTFFKIVLPQSMTQFIPNFQSALIALVQGTSVVGYIAVQDLTRASDIIRGRTYEAFFPLISTAIIYLLLGWLLTVLVRRIGRLFEPARRSDERVLAQFKSTQTGKARLRNPFANAADTLPAIPDVREDAEGDATPANAAGDADAAGGPEVIVRFDHLKKEYPNITPIKDLCATVQRGDVVSLIGPSGTGKSTLLRMTNMLESPTQGSISFHGIEITAPKFPLHELRGCMGMVFQSFNLFNHLTVIENVTLAPTYLKGMAPAEAYRKGMALLEKVGLAEFALAYPDNLSGGQKQRAAIARTIAMDPEVILLDEPTSALDPTMVEEVETVIRELANEGYTMMLVTHDMELAKRIANRVLFLYDGVVCESGTPDQIFNHPQQEQTKRFIHRMKTYECIIENGNLDFPGILTQINGFVFKHNLSKSLSLKIKSIFEELCFRILAPKMGEGSMVRFSLNYSSKERNAILVVRYKGVSPIASPSSSLSQTDLASENLFDGNLDSAFDDLISWRIIMGRAEKVVFHPVEEDEYVGKISIKVN